MVFVTNGLAFDFLVLIISTGFANFNRQIRVKGPSICRPSFRAEVCNGFTCRSDCDHYKTAQILWTCTVRVAILVSTPEPTHSFAETPYEGRAVRGYQSFNKVTERWEIPPILTAGRACGVIADVGTAVIPRDVHAFLPMGPKISIGIPALVWACNKMWGRRSSNRAALSALSTTS